MIKRGPKKHAADYGMIHYYRYYHKTVKYTPFETSFSPKNPSLIVDKKTYRAMVRRMFELMAQKLLKAEIIDLPNLGSLSIRKKKMNFGFLKEHRMLKMNYKHFKETGQKVFYTNEHTSNYRMRYTWNKFSVRVKTKSAYRFIPVRKAARDLAFVLLNTKQDFLEEFVKPKLVR